MKNNLKISVRLDDICPTLNWANFYKVISICEKYNIKPLLGIVPNNKDKKLMVNEENKDFFDIMRQYQDKGFLFAQHGLDHVYRNKKGGILKLNKQSDFVGLSKEEQFKYIKEGFDILKAENINTEIYMAPSHSYDKNTILAIKDIGFKYITDGYTSFNYEWQGITFIPCMDTFKLRKKGKGFCTLCLHINTMSEKNITSFEQTLEKNKDFICDYSYLLNQPTQKRFICKQKYTLLIEKIKGLLYRLLKKVKKR